MNMMGKIAPALPDLEPGHPCFDCAVRELAVCGVLEAAALRAFKSSGPTVHYKAGDTVVFEADEAANVYSLTAGLLRLSKLLPDGRRQIAGFLFPGDFLGITMEEEHAFTAEAVAPSTLCKFPRSRFDQMVASNPQLERRLYAVAAHELAAARQQLVLLGRKTATERVASFLLMISGRCTTRQGAEIDLPISRIDMADYLGLRIETVSREISALKVARVIQLTGRQTFRIIDRNRLDQLADGE
ncbi:helix-turn-helix domain-containing protein [Sphingomonas rhizophila]|uniref:Helix-turn-helix domain-containing protein n=1 Tax=Sphingomonas rhizophila TaxID=2071607 RepID=A0A7G9S9X7_9SPHN|nr:helix-turn-helix domain-containing protein [Sphingomonas rhizophila]QNN64652.1 helix-turn-helix domain-containing protein [Sphingomonas rhizophila]